MSIAKILTLKTNLVGTLFIALLSSVMTVGLFKGWEQSSLWQTARIQSDGSTAVLPPGLPLGTSSVLECGNDVYSPVQKHCVDQKTFDQEMARLFAALGLDSKLYQTQGN